MRGGHRGPPGRLPRQAPLGDVHPHRGFLVTPIVELFAGLRVRDFAQARRWYERLLGEPSFLPHDTEAVWTLGEGRSIYIEEHAGSPGNGELTVFVDDLDGCVAAIAERGLEPDERETYSNGVRKVTYRDPDGNEIGFGGAPVG